MSGRVLVVEDDADIRETLGELLEHEGYDVTLAQDGANALSRLDAMASLPNLILLDLMMPVMDGFEFRRAQRENARLSAIPVVVMSADPQVEAHAAALEVRRCIRKPFDIADLLCVTAAEVAW